jgi:hypothetical protein
MKYLRSDYFRFRKQSQVNFEKTTIFFFHHKIEYGQDKKFILSAWVVSWFDYL